MCEDRGRSGLFLTSGVDGWMGVIETDRAGVSDIHIGDCGRKVDDVENIPPPWHVPFGHDGISSAR